MLGLLYHPARCVARALTQFGLHGLTRSWHLWCRCSVILESEPYTLPLRDKTTMPVLARFPFSAAFSRALRLHDRAFSCVASISCCRLCCVRVLGVVLLLCLIPNAEALLAISVVPGSWYLCCARSCSRW